MELRVLGAVELTTARGSPLLSPHAQPKRIGLLTYLALARPRGAHRRDALVALFWPELDEAHARAALRQAVHHLRQVLGECAIAAHGHDQLALDPGSLCCDATVFEAELDAGHSESALALYRGDLLEGFFLHSAPGFEQWLERERARLRNRAAAGAWAAAELRAGAGAVDAAAEWGSRALALSHDDEAALQRLLRLLERLGDRVRAVREYDAFARRVQREYEIEPSVDTRRLIDAIRSRISLQIPAPAAAVDVDDRTPPAAGLAAGPVQRRPWRHARWSATAGAAIVILLLLWALRPLGRVGSAAPPSLAHSPDGQDVVYVAGRGDGTRLCLVRRGDPVPRALPGTERGVQPVFSPDGRWVLFFAGNEVKKVAVPAGRAVGLATPDSAWLALDRCAAPPSAR